MLTSEKRLDILNRARTLSSMDGDHDQALQLIELLLDGCESDVDALRLKGNILDLKALTEEGTNREALFNKAKECYEEILRMDSSNPVAHIDLADYWTRRNDFDRALEHFSSALTLLKQGHEFVNLEQELAEAFSGKAELLERMGRRAEAIICITEAKVSCPNSRLFSKNHNCGT